jgi:UDP-glucose:glycoprotein glucosyltransferase
MSSLLALDFSGSGSSSSPEYAIDIRDSAVMWVNDIENDKQYRRWSDSLLELLRPTFPGMLRSVRRNLYNLVSVTLSSLISKTNLVHLLNLFIFNVRSASTK